MGNIYTKQRALSEYEICELAQRIVKCDEIITFDGQVITSTLLKHRLARVLDVNSRQRLVQELVKHCNHYCKHCGSKLLSCDVTYERWPVQDGFSDRCQQCTRNQVWKRGKFEKRGEKISISKLAFYQTDEGRAIARVNGQKISTSLKDYYQTPRGHERRLNHGHTHSRRLRMMISTGAFKPGVHNYWTNWDAAVTIGETVHKFRSSWEACFFICHQTLMYEKMRIPYIENDVHKTYIPDFFDSDARVIYEIKPTTRFNRERIKMNSAITWCNANAIEFVHLHEHNLIDYLDVCLLTSCDEYLTQWNKAKETLCIN